MNSAATAAKAVVPELQGDLRAEVVSDLLAIETEWSALCDEARAGNVFLGPEWLVPWWKQFGEGREICSIAVRDGERLGVVAGVTVVQAEGEGGRALGDA